MLQPLAVEPIDRSLAQAPEDLAPLRTALHTDEALRSLLKTPLMLSLVTLTYRDMPDKAMFTSGTPEVRNAQLFDTYIAQMLKWRGKNQTYTPEQTVRWLSWLAQKLRQDGQSVFYIENMQPTSFLKTGFQRLVFAVVLGLLLALPMPLNVLPIYLTGFDMK